MSSRWIRTAARRKALRCNCISLETQPGGTTQGASQFDEDARRSPSIFISVAQWLGFACSGMTILRLLLLAFFLTLTARVDDGFRGVRDLRQLCRAYLSRCGRNRRRLRSCAL